jgi:hypothetical protein
MIAAATKNQGQRQAVNARDKAPMIKHLSTITVLWISFMFAACEVAQAVEPPEFGILTAKGARRIRHHDLQQMSARQLSYTVKLGYPGMAVGQSHYAQLSKRGWTECTGTRVQWDSYVNSVDQNNPYCVYEVGKYLIKDNDLMLVSLRYQGRLHGKLSCPSKPDNSTQYVVAIIYEHKDRESMQLGKLGLSCGK